MKELKNLIALMLEQDFFTKGNQPIEFKIHKQSPDKGDQLSRGWVVHKIEAFINKKPAGWIKISYVPDEKFKKEYSNIVQFAEKIAGNLFSLGREYDHLRNKADYPTDNFNNYPLIVQVYGLHTQVQAWPGYTYEKLEELSNKELLELKEKFLKMLWKRHGKRFEEFQDFHINKPLVDYIKVYPEFQRQRIGVALYEKAAKWLAGKGMKLYASGIQTNEAQKAWEWLRKHKGANIGTEKHGDTIRTYLSFL